MGDKSVDVGLLKIVAEKAKSIFRILGQRYLLCNTHGHLKPNLSGNTCNYCYRRLNYGTPETDARYAWKKGLHFMDVPLDALSVREQRLREIELQQSDDFVRGIVGIKEELQL